MSALHPQERDALTRSLQAQARELEAEANRLQGRAREIENILEVLRRHMTEVSTPPERPAVPRAPETPDRVRLADQPSPFLAVRQASVDAPQLPPLRAMLLGEFRIFRGREAVRPEGGGKVWRLVKFFMSRGGGPVPRDVLIETFWRRSRMSMAMQSVYSAIHSMRRLLAGDSGQNYVTCHDGAYQLAPGATLETDVAYFEQLVREARGARARGDGAGAAAALRRAIACYPGEYLADEPYERWALDEREILRSHYLEALGTLAVLAEEAGDLQGAAELHRRVLAREPLREPSHRALILIHGETGRRDLAVRQYRALERLLSRELGVAPEARTRAAISDILTGDRGGQRRTVPS